MTLGSPSSPTSPHSYGSPFYHNQANAMGTQGPAPHTHNGFLPGYLMGDYSQQVCLKYYITFSINITTFFDNLKRS